MNIKIPLADVVGRPWGVPHDGHLHTIWEDGPVSIIAFSGECSNVSYTAALKGVGHYQSYNLRNVKEWIQERGVYKLTQQNGCLPLELLIFAHDLAEAKEVGECLVHRAGDHLEGVELVWDSRQAQEVVK